VGFVQQTWFHLHPPLGKTFLLFPPDCLEWASCLLGMLFAHSWLQLILEVVKSPSSTFDLIGTYRILWGTGES
jgi:hypothetical protein